MGHDSDTAGHTQWLAGLSCLPTSCGPVFPAVISRVIRHCAVSGLEHRVALGRIAALPAMDLAGGCGCGSCSPATACHTRSAHGVLLHACPALHGMF